MAFLPSLPWLSVNPAYLFRSTMLEIQEPAGRSSPSAPSSLRSLEDSVHDNAHVRERNRLGYGGDGATIHHFLSLGEFVAEVRKVFDFPLSGKEAARKLFQLRLNFRSGTDYAVDFCTFSAESVWNLESLFDMFLHDLSEVVKDELAAQELPMDLNSLVALTIWIDGQLQECRRERTSVPSHTRSSKILRGIPEVPEVDRAERIRRESRG
jgi:hypothetical protein